VNVTHQILMCLLSGEVQRGLQLYEALTAPSPTDRRWGGYALFSEGRLLEAKDLLLIAQGQGCLEANIELATVLRHLGQVESAHQRLDLLDGRTLLPFDQTLWLRERGALLQGEGRLDAAAEVLEQAWTSACSSEACGPLRFQTAQILGYVYGQLGLDVQARHYLTHALQLAAPIRRVQPLASQGLTLTYLGEYEAAEASYQEALTLAPEGHGFRPTVLYGWSTLQRARGLWRDALESYGSVIDLARTQADTGTEFFALLGAAAIETALHRFEQANHWLQRASRLATTPRRALFLTWRRGTLDVQHQQESGIALLLQARDGFLTLGLHREAGWTELHLAEAGLHFQQEDLVQQALQGVVSRSHQLGGASGLLIELRGLPLVQARFQEADLPAVQQQLLRDWKTLGYRVPLRVEILTLGQAGVRVDGEALHLPLRRALEVLTFLLAQPGSSRNQLLTALWPDDSPTRSVSYFHQVRHELEKAIPGLALLHDRQTRTYSVRAEGIVLDWDVASLQRDLKERSPQSLNRALDRYRGPFLPQAESEWARMERDTLEWSVISCGLNLMEAWSREREWKKCLDLAQRLLTIDPVNVALAEYLMQATLELEGLVASRQVLGQLADRFEHELGTVPPTLKAWQNRLTFPN